MASTGEAWRLGRRPALDNVRGFAVLIVVLCHTYPDGVPGGGAAGVSVFFTLSGFLITSLLLEEYDESGRISLLGFYRRRANRLLPALAVFLAVMLLLSLWINAYFAPPIGVAAGLLYCVNWLAMNGFHVGGIDHTWSLSVEEQFYILFPLPLLALLPRVSRRSLFATVAAMAGASMLLRLWLSGSGATVARVYYGTDTNAVLLLLGCAGAIGMTIWKPQTPRPPVAYTAVAGIAVLCFIPGETRTYVPVLASALSLVTIVALSAGAAGPAARPAAPLALLGRRSYGLYLWHFPLTMGLAPMVAAFAGLPELAVRTAAVAVAWGLTCLSWRYVEKPMLDRRRGDPVAVEPAPVAV